MAAVKSLGVHTPVALPYLIGEGLLPPDPKPELYQWETYAVQDTDGSVEEEVLATRTCVVWSQSQLVRTVYRFELEGEDVRQAVLTTFPDEHTKRLPTTRDLSKVVEGFGKSSRRSTLPPRPKALDSELDDEPSPAAPDTASRALVVFLKTKAHVYFLHGSHHIIDLPFEVERAFPAPRGLLLQRKFQPEVDQAITSPKVPAAPQNSFFSSQAHPTSSYLQSPTLARSFAGSQPFKPSPLTGLGGSNDWLNGLYNSVCGAPDRWDEREAAGLYSLTSPLSDIGMVTESIQNAKPRITSRAPHGVDVGFDALDHAEKIVYVSSGNELPRRPDGRRAELMLIVTVNQEMRLATVWHGWYIDEQSLATLMKKRAEHKAAKARRRSSFLGTSIGSGTATPAVRHRDGGRESFAPGASLHVPEPQPSRPARSQSRKPTRLDDEAAMALQLDPDSQAPVTREKTRESRRISSMVSRAEHAADARAGPGTSFGGTAARRHTSFGPQGERRSFGLRRSRGSTPGSVFRASVGMDGDSEMDLDSETYETSESTEAVLRHVRNTYDVAGTDNVFGCLDERFKHELVVRKVHSFNIGQQPWTRSPPKTSIGVKVATLCERLPSIDTEDQRVAVYLLDESTGETSSLVMDLKQRILFPELVDSAYATIPSVVKIDTTAHCSDLIKLVDGTAAAALVGGRGLLISPSGSIYCPLPATAPYRRYSALDLSSTSQSPDKDVGRNRVLPSPTGILTFKHAGPYGTFDECGADGMYHRRQLKFAPSDVFTGNVLDVCQLVLPTDLSHQLGTIWCKAHDSLIRHEGAMTGTACGVEWVAFVASIMTMTIDLLDEKAKASLQIGKLAGSPPSGLSAAQLQLRQHQQALLERPAWSWMRISRATQDNASSLQGEKQKDRLLSTACALAQELRQGDHSDMSIEHGRISDIAVKLMLALHLFREEQKLDTLSATRADRLAPVIAQLGSLLGLHAWSQQTGCYYALEGADETHWAFLAPSAPRHVPLSLMEEPVGVFEWLEHALKHGSVEAYPSIATIAQLGADIAAPNTFIDAADKYTPRITALSKILAETHGLSTSAVMTVEVAAKWRLNAEMLETLPEAVAAPFREAIARCEREPPTTWPKSLLRLIGREDLQLDGDDSAAGQHHGAQYAAITPPAKDVQSIVHAYESPVHAVKTREADRHAISQLLFSDDRRLVEATTLMHFNSVQIAECPKQPDWTDAFHFDQQRRVMQWVTTRMIALPAGDGMIHYDSQTPLMTEKYHLPGFSSSCVMQPMGHTVTTDRSGLTEEKVNWAYFHAGVSAGLRISRSAKGIDTSWLVFNKPTDLTNRHAGLLLALGLNGHLRTLAKWLSFKYLTPKHTMTSVGLLLGISASYMGTMDSLITRMLSVHITSMLPPGAAELNVAPTTQTAGLMGIGLLYYNTQHRRMSEIMLHEIELLDVEDIDNTSPESTLREESYRLAAGFALGFMNLAKGVDLRGLYGMHLPERLLNIAVGPRPVNAVHVFDKATAGAIMALALVYMKSGDESIARKVDIPETQAQYEHVRPDMLMLRSMARHVILWDSMQAQGKINGVPGWLGARLPKCYQGRMKAQITGRATLSSADVPFYYIATGLAWALSLKYAGSADLKARDEILATLDHFHAIKSKGDAFYYDAKLARSALRRCIDVLALAAAVVMAGTGDLQTFRYLRRLHGRTDAETPYGSHLAAHLAIGTLFLGGGTYTFGTSDLAVAALIVAFYPLWPTDVQDNRVHLQAFRHLWVFAAEPRCVVVEDIDTRRPITMPLELTLRDGSAVRQLQAPCLLPELISIDSLATADPAYWRVTLDFAANPSHLAAFRKDPRILVRRCPAAEAHTSIFSATLAALNSTHPAPVPAGNSSNPGAGALDWIFNLRALKQHLDKADIELLLPPDIRSATYLDDRGTAVDDRLALASIAQHGSKRDELWNLRLLFAWAEKAEREGDGRLRWIGREAVEALRGEIEKRGRDAA